MIKKILFLLLFLGIVLPNVYAGNTSQMNTTNISETIGKQFQDNIIGGDDTSGEFFLGLMIIIIFLLLSFISRIGLIAITILGLPLGYYLAIAGMIPMWIAPLLIMLVGGIWAFVLIKVFNIK